jgi:molecular chaperone GrpE
MSEQPTADVPEATSERCAQLLTPERIEAVLADFRSWLYQAAERGATTDESESVGEAIDLSTLLGQFAALRHEVNLQTKAVRAQQEQNAQTLAALQAAMTAPAPDEEDDEEGRIHARTLIEIYDALAMAAREAKRMRDAILPQLTSTSPEDKPENPVPAPAPPSLFARLFGAADASQTIASLRRESASLRECLAEARSRDGRVRGLLDSLLTGYGMSLQRLERALRQNDLDPMECVGEPFDPERMEALEVVADGGHGRGEVIEEVRRGFMRRGRVFRFAQVRVKKNS